MSASDPTLQPDAPLWVALHGLIARRIDEVWALAEHLPDPDRVVELHELRIASKGLRYDLEAFRDCLPKRGERLIKVFKQLQDLLGAVHDVDVQAARLMKLLTDHADAQRGLIEGLDEKGAAHPRLEPAAAELAHAAADVPTVGLALVLADLAAERRRLHAELVERWHALDQDDLRGRLLEAVSSVMS